MGEGLDVAASVSAEGAPIVDLAFAVPPGIATTVMGPSGSGKSTLLSWVMGDLAPGLAARGHVRLDGAELTRLPPERRRIGLLHQDPLLFPHLSVGANLMFGLPRAVRGRAARRARIEAALAEVGLDGMADRDPATLSGGQAARAALQRVLLSGPRALLLDEPFSKLDAALRGQVRSLVLDRARAAGVPVLLVTHDSDDAAAAGGPVIRLG